tara:strand:- start:1139 stop:3625 length:2487 start_codon:yes stop_codon:yes gene_type:complete
MATQAGPNLIHRTLIVAGLAVTVIVGMAAYQVRHAYTITVDTHQTEIQQLAQILETSTSTTFQSVDLLLSHAAEEVLDQEAIPGLYKDLTDRFVAIANPWNFVHSVAYIKEDGKVGGIVVRRSDGIMQGMDLNADFSERFGFNVHSTATVAAADAVYISEPVPEIISPGMVIAVTKAVYDQNGQFRGVCFVTISLETFAELYRGLLPAAYKSVNLFRRDGVRLYLEPPGLELGVSVANRPLFSQRLRESPSGVFRALSASEQIEHLVAYRESRQYPIVITVSAIWSHVLANWRADSYLFAGSALIGIAMILFLTWWVVRRIKAEQIVQAELLKNEHSLAEAQRLGGVSYFERNLRTGVMTWTDDTYAAHGVDPSSFTPSREAFLELVVPEDRSKITSRWGPLDNPVPYGEAVCRIIRPDGELRYMRYSWKILENESNSPGRTFGVVQDVTALQAAEDTIRDDETRLRDIIECSSDYIWESNIDGLLTFFTGDEASQFGDVIGRHRSIFNYRNNSLSGGDMLILHEALSNRRKFRNLIVPAIDARGEKHWVRVSGNPRYDRDGHFAGFRGAGSDVTELKRQQDSAEHRRKVEALGRLAGGLAHEINNLIQPILIYATVGESTPGISQTIKKYFSRIARASEHATLIVKNVLAYAREGQPKRDNVSILGVVSETAELVETMLASKVSLVVDENVADAQVLVDRTGLAQALTNLITNAGEAMPEGGTIVVRAEEEQVSAEMGVMLGFAPGRFCRLDVEDNGTGISPDHLAKVFDPFFTTKAQGKGTGLGLSVVLGFVKSWGGTVIVDSKEGRGTCFSMYLPIAELQVQAAQ